MKGKRLAKLAVNFTWVLLVLLVITLFVKERLAYFPTWVKKLRKEPQALVQAFQPRDMVGFRCAFADPSDLDLWDPKQAAIEITPSPLGGSDTWAKVTYYPAVAPSLFWTDETIGLMDWRKAESFSFSAYNPQAWDVDLKLKVKDVSGNKYQKTVVLPSKRLVTVAMPVKEVAERLDTSHVNYLNLFLWQPSTETVIYYTNFEFTSSRHPATSTALVRFMGLELPGVAKRGETVEGAFYFIAREKINGDHLLLVRLRRGKDIYSLVQVEPPYPTSKWHPERLTKVGPLPVSIPENLEEGEYEVEVILARPVQDKDGLQYIFQPYANPALTGFGVTKLTVTGNEVK